MTPNAWPDRVIRIAAGVTVVALAVIAGAISYSHMHELAVDHGEVGWRGHAFPLSVDGIEIVASLVLLAHRRARTHAGALPWAALVVGTLASLTANVAVAPVDVIGRAVAGWPATALLVAVKLLSGLLDGAEDAETPARSTNGINTVVSAAPGTKQPRVRRSRRVVGWRSPDPGNDPQTLETAARSARDTLTRQGRRLSQRALAERLRADGFRVRNDRAGELVRMLHAEIPTAGHLVNGTVDGEQGVADGGGRHA